MSRVRSLVPLISFLVLTVLLAAGLTRDPSQLPSELIDRPFPDFTLSTLKDPGVELTALPDEVVLVNIFGSWCTACVQEHPKLMELARTDNVSIIGVNWRDSREKGLRWLERYGNPYDVILFDDSSQLAIDLGVTGAPETFVVDKDGKIRYKHVGIITNVVWRDILQPLIISLEDVK